MVNISVLIDFTLKDVPENRDFYFNATWKYTLKEDNILKAIPDLLHTYKETTLFWGVIFTLGSYIVSKLDL
ncbi:MAG: hypothetical protein ACFFDN_51305 [Candidatus Hodarchaeota archaeon]